MPALVSEVVSEGTGLEDFRALLRLQEIDTEIDQLRFRRDHLPMHDSLHEVQQRAAALRPKLTKAIADRDGIAARQVEIEAEVDAIEHRIKSINERLYDGSANLAPSDALAMSQEVTHLNERRSGLEDRELAVMEALEPAQAEVDQFEAVAHELAREMQSAQSSLGDAQREIDAAVSKHQSERDAAVSKVSPPLLAEYETLRKKLGGQAVAPLSGNSCGGCHLVLAATEVDAIRKAPETAVVHCEECGRILVR